MYNATKNMYNLSIISVAYPVVENYVKNTWEKFSFVMLMMIKNMHFFKFGSKEGMEAILESGAWLIRNVSLILKEWTLDVNIMKEDVCNILVWVKFCDVPITAFIEDGRASFARAMIELKADVELRDTIVVFVPKFSSLVSTKKAAKAKGNPKVQTTHTLNSFDVLSTLVDEEERGGNQTPSTNATRVVSRINELEIKMLDRKLVLVDENGKPLEIKFPNDETSRYMSSTGGGGLFEDDLDFYDGYEAQVYNLPEQMQTFCDQFDNRPRSHVRK
ncbi:zinc knuckle CX2CX4HX4C containing protein [Tanacetum coccineum]